jgi:hypothetical protein
MKRCSLIIVLIATLCLSGCGMEYSLTMDESNNPRIDMYICMTEEEALQAGATSEDIKSAKTVTVNGETYYKFSTTDGLYNESVTGDETVTESTTFSADYYNQYDGITFCMLPDGTGSSDSVSNLISDNSSEDTSASMSSGADYDFSILSVKMLDSIILTNGTVSDDGLTVTYCLDNGSYSEDGFYAYTASSTSIIRIRELYDSKWSKTKTIHIDTVDEIKSVKVDGKTAKVKDTDTGVSVKLPDGNHKVTVKTANAEKTFTVKVDSTKPTVAGVKNGKTYSKAVTIKFSDETSGIKKATLNGKTIETGKKVTKAGSYTLKVTDKAGNTKTIKFKIKK